VNDDKDVKMQKRIFFVGTIFGVIVGILGNLLVTSGFELAHYLHLNEIPNYSTWLWCIFIGSIFLLGYLSYLAMVELKETL
jgi:hypothetical protein